LPASIADILSPLASYLARRLISIGSFGSATARSFYISILRLVAGFGYFYAGFVAGVFSEEFYFAGYSD